MRLLLLQIRDADDPMGPQELHCFQRRLPRATLTPHSLLHGPGFRALEGYDAVMIGGSGNYSCVENRTDWFRDACRALELILERDVPLFASCWGIQALGHVLGVPVIHDKPNREVGTFPIHLTEEAMTDPVFAGLPRTFPAQLGHEDRLAHTPPGATLLAWSDRTPVQAFRLDGRPVYATQFHPELNREENLERLQNYRKKYRLDDEAYERMAAAFLESPDTEPLLDRFLTRCAPAPGASASPSSAPGA